MRIEFNCQIVKQNNLKTRVVDTPTLVVILKPYLGLKKTKIVLAICLFCLACAALAIDLFVYCKKNISTESRQSLGH